MNKTPLIEVCVDSIESAIAAEKGGADRIELCASLFEGGITPSAGCIELTLKNVSIDTNVIIRPRGGDFFYTEIEFEVMKKDIIIAKNLGANGVVLGILNRDGSVDVGRTKELVDLARPMTITFHRAFDMTPDPFKALEDIISLGINRILTSGQERTALEGIDLISDLVKAANGRIIIMAGGGVNERNINKLYTKTSVQELHSSGRVKMDSAMTYRKSHVFMGGELRLPEYEVSIVASERIKSLKDSL